MAGDDPPITNSSKAQLPDPIDENSPYFLHHSDSPGTVLVSHRLTGDNYATWSRAMNMALVAKNKVGFVDGSLPQPDSKSPTHSLWIRANTMVCSWIINACDRDLADSVVFASSAYEVWKDLHDRFSRKNAPRIFQLTKLITNLLQHQSSLSSYYTKLKQLWDELASYSTFTPCSCATSFNFNAYQDQERLMQFLMGLNDSYGPVRSQILLMEPLPSVSRAYSFLLQDETQRGLHVSSQTTDHAAFSARIQKNVTSHPSEVSSNPLFCRYCKKDGHLKENCYKLHRYPKGHPRYNPNHYKKPPPHYANNVAHSAPTTQTLAEPSAISASPQFTSEQHQQILHLLQARAGSSSSISHLTGNIICSTLSSFWIMDH